MKLVFAGTPEFSARHLAALAASEHEILCVYTQPDRPAGRGNKLSQSPVKHLALELGLPCRQPQHLKDPVVQAELTALGADILIVVAYGLILPQPALAAGRLGALNVHASLLPRWRGAAPIQRAIEAGDSETGICIMQMERGLDTGPVLARSSCAIEFDDTAGTLHDKLAALGPPLLLETLAELARGAVKAEPQPAEGVTYAHKILPPDAQLDFHDSATALARKIRAYNPFPGAWGELEGERVKIWAAAPADLTHSETPGTLIHVDGALLVATGCGSALAVTELQLPGKTRIPARHALQGVKLSPGRTFERPSR